MCGGRVARARVGLDQVGLPVNDVRLGYPVAVGEVACALESLDRGFRAGQAELQQTECRVDVEPPELVVVLLDECHRVRGVIAASAFVADRSGEASETHERVRGIDGLRHLVAQVGHFVELSGRDLPPPGPQIKLRPAA